MSCLGGCDHAASYRYFSETIQNNGRYPALVCNNEKEAQNSDTATSVCKSSNALMGEASLAK